MHFSWWFEFCNCYIEEIQPILLGDLNELHRKAEDISQFFGEIRGTLTSEKQQIWRGWGFLSAYWQVCVCVCVCVCESDGICVLAGGSPACVRMCLRCGQPQLHSSESKLLSIVIAMCLKVTFFQMPTLLRGVQTAAPEGIFPSPHHSFLPFLSSFGMIPARHRCRLGRGCLGEGERVHRFLSSVGGWFDWIRSRDSAEIGSTRRDFEGIERGYHFLDTERWYLREWERRWWIWGFRWGSQNLLLGWLKDEEKPIKSSWFVGWY